MYSLAKNRHNISELEIAYLFFFSALIAELKMFPTLVRCGKASSVWNVCLCAFAPFNLRWKLFTQCVVLCMTEFPDSIISSPFDSVSISDCNAPCSCICIVTASVCFSELFLWAVSSQFITASPLHMFPWTHCFKYSMLPNSVTSVLAIVLASLCLIGSYPQLTRAPKVFHF